MSLEQILRQVNLGKAEYSVMLYALSLQTNGAMQAGILFERLIDEQFVQNDVNNVLKKVPFSVYGAIFTKELMSDLSIARVAYDLAVQTYFRFSEGFLIEQAKKWEEAYLTDTAFRGFGLSFMKYSQASIEKLLVANSKYTCVFTYTYLEKTNQHQSFPSGL